MEAMFKAKFWKNKTKNKKKSKKKIKVPREGFGAKREEDVLRGREQS